jgi:hypothetical protein
MTLATPSDTTAGPEPTARASGLVVRTTARGRSTDLDVLAHDHLFTVAVPSCADDDMARRMLALFRQISSVRIDVRGAVTTATVRGVRHRCPAEQTVGLATALGLLARGVPTLVGVERESV